MSGTRLSSCAETSSLGSSASVAKSTVEARSGRHLRARSSIIPGDREDPLEDGILHARRLPRSGGVAIGTPRSAGWTGGSMVEWVRTWEPSGPAAASRGVDRRPPR